MDQDDRRRSIRVHAVAVASLATRGLVNENEQALCTVRDLSRSGIGLETGQPPVIGQVVVLRLALDDNIHELQTRATRVKRKRDSHFYSIGLDWSGCSEEELSFLDEVLGVIAEGSPEDTIF